MGYTQLSFVRCASITGLCLSHKSEISSTYLTAQTESEILMHETGTCFRMGPETDETYR